MSYFECLGYVTASIYIVKTALALLVAVFQDNDFKMQQSPRQIVGVSIVVALGAACVYAISNFGK